LACKLNCASDIAVLRAFYTPGQQDDQRRALTQKIQAVSGAEIDAHCRNTATNRLAVPEVTQRHTVNADVDTWTRLPIPQAGEPILEYRRFANLDHLLTVIHGLLFCKLVLDRRKQPNFQYLRPFASRGENVASLGWIFRGYIFI
jgi:hypothetical protein